MKTLENDHELDEARKEVDHLKIMRQEINNKEKTLTSWLKERQNKSNKNDKEIFKEITSLKRELEEAKRIEDVMPPLISTRFHWLSWGKHEMRATMTWLNLLHHLTEMESTKQDIINFHKVLQDF